LKVLDEKIIEKDYTSNFQAEVNDLNIVENIKKANPTLIQTENKLFSHFLILKV